MNFALDILLDLEQGQGEVQNLEYAYLCIKSLTISLQKFRPSCSRFFALELLCGGLIFGWGEGTMNARTLGIPEGMRKIRFFAFYLIDLE